MAKSHRILVPQKIDLDVCGAAWLLGVTRDWQVEVLRGEASEEDLADPKVFCIEVGGSGRVETRCFDHHKAGGPTASATEQALQWGWAPLRGGLPPTEGLPPTAEPRLFVKLVSYIDKLDTEGPKALGPSPGFPTLSDVFSGMLLTVRDPVEQLHRGVEILREVVQKGLDPFGRIPTEEVPEWDTYAGAKADHDRQVVEVLEKAQRIKTSSGLRLAYVETEFYGAPGALCRRGAQVVVALNPNFYGTRKATIAGDNIRVDAVLPELNELEPGWGGPPTGTIIGSPREGGTDLSLEEIVEIVKKTL